MLLYSFNALRPIDALRYGLRKRYSSGNFHVEINISYDGAVSLLLIIYLHFVRMVVYRCAKEIA